MAFHKHFKLSTLKLTQHSSTGVHVQDIHRGVSSQQSLSEGQRGLEEQDDSSPAFPVESNACTYSEQLDEPTLHELQSKASMKAWDKLRKGILCAATESSAMPIGQLCLQCSSPAVLRCQQCGPLVHYCIDCFKKHHERVNIFHVAEKWEVRQRGDHYIGKKY